MSSSTKVLKIRGKYYGISFLSLFHVVYSLYTYTFLGIQIFSVLLLPKHPPIDPPLQPPLAPVQDLNLRFQIQNQHPL